MGHLFFASIKAPQSTKRTSVSFDFAFALRDLQSRSYILLLLATLSYASIKAQQSRKRTSVRRNKSLIVLLLLAKKCIYP